MMPPPGLQIYLRPLMTLTLDLPTPKVDLFIRVNNLCQLLKLTTDRYEASRGLIATAELLVGTCYQQTLKNRLQV